MTEATLFVNGRVYTGRRYARALLVEEGRVVSVGAEEAVRPLAPAGVERVDLEGGLLVPGLADAHLHIGEIARERDGLDLGGLRSVADLQRRIEDRLRERPGVAVVGRGLVVDQLAEQRWPTATELDQVAAELPVVLVHASGHAAVANSAALRSAFADDPPRADGLLLEEELRPLRPTVAAALPLTEANVAATLDALAALGLTSVGTMNTDEEELGVLRAIAAAGRLPIRVRAYPPVARVNEAGTALRAERSNRLDVVGVKAFLDGAFGPRTASLREPYSDDSASRGTDRERDEQLVPSLRQATDRGLAPALHAIGDRAVLRGARLLRDLPPTPAPARIEHASLTPPEVVEQLTGPPPFLVVQPGFLLTDVWLRERLGARRARWAYAFRTLQARGIPLAGSSDAPFDRPDPWRGIRAAVTRRDELGRSANPSPDEALPVEAALGLYLGGAHRALGLPEGGLLEAGARADAVLLDVARLSEAIRPGGGATRSVWVEGRRILPEADGAERRR